MRSALDQLRGIDIGMMIGVVRMDADAGPDVGIRFSSGEHIIPFAFARRDVEHRRDAPLPCTRQHLALRSEEHTSELQSLMRISYAVFCLKKKKDNTHTKQK